VLGAASNPERDVHMASLLDQGFEQLDVPIAPRTMMASRRMPSLIATAQAATVLPTAVRAAPPPVPTARTPVASRAPLVPRWSIQVGTFSTEKAARQAAIAAQNVVDGDARVDQVKLKGRPAWRAQLTGLTAAQAQAACGNLAKHRSACFVVRPDQGQIASR
jgi:D-alanyl-D-alanine carboxypeptidase